jgi:hypothetical protein
MCQDRAFTILCTYERLMGETGWDKDLRVETHAAALNMGVMTILPHK